MRWALVVAWIGWGFKTAEIMTVGSVFMSCVGKTKRDVLGDVDEHIAWGILQVFAGLFENREGARFFALVALDY
eukprot:4135584-Ditylum_brightwellii.AAC.1